MVHMGASPLSAEIGSISSDFFLGDQLEIMQPKKGFRAGVDSVFVAASIPAKPGDSIFEAGCGVGAAALCLCRRVRDTYVTGVEIESSLVKLAHDNATKNKLSANFQVIEADIRAIGNQYMPNWPMHNTFSHAFANPPYFEDDKARIAPNHLRARAHCFKKEDLEIWIKLLVSMVAPKGSVTIIHRAETLSRILQLFEGRVGDIRVAPLFPREGEVATRVIVQGIKGSKAPMQLLQGRVLHGDSREFAPESEAVLRFGAAFPMR